MTPERLGRYEILGELGKGAMGLVFLAQDPLIGRQLALKTFRLGYSAGDAELEQFRQRFLREAQSAGILNHPNIVTIHDVVVEKGDDFFIAMEYVKGTDLKQLMQRQRKLDLQFVVDVVAQIADGLDYAHSKGVVHRDIKPANIIITAEKQAKITDFGIARVDASNLTVEGQLLGTPNYMAPEQIQGKEIDHRADIFSLGVMLYELLTGKKPFHGENLTVVTHRIVYDAFTPPDELIPGLPENLLQVLQRALAKDPEDRYSCGGDMATDLRATFELSGTHVVQKAAAVGTTGSFLADSPPAAPPAAGSPAAAGGLPQGSLAGDAPPPAAPLAAAPAAAPAATLTPVPPPSTGSIPIPAAERKPIPPAVIAALAVGGVLSLALLGYVFFNLMSGGDEPPPVTVDPMEEQRRLIQPHLDAAQEMLAAGDPSAALTELERARTLAPDDREVRRLRDQAKRELAVLGGEETDDGFVQDRVDAAQEALRIRDYKLAVRLLDEALERTEASPEKLAEARDLRQQAEEGRRRQERISDRFRTTPGQPPPDSSQVSAAPPPATPPPAVAAETTLRIELYSEVSEGRLTIFSGQQKIYQEAFKFVGEKRGLLRRAKKTPGSLKATVTLTVGEVDLGIYVRPKGSQTKSTKVKGTLVAGGDQVLRIEVSENGTVSAKLE